MYNMSPEEVSSAFRFALLFSRKRKRVYSFHTMHSGNIIVERTEPIRV
jgi:hypothetical protein